MESEHIKGAANKAAGKIREKTGDAIGNKEMEIKGKAQQLKGKAQDKIGDIKDAMEEEE